MESGRLCSRERAALTASPSHTFLGTPSESWPGIGFRRAPVHNPAVHCITSHGARHTAGSSYAVMGAGQKVIGALLGHSDSASTERYTHVAPSATAALVQARWTRLGGGEGGR